MQTKKLYNKEESKETKRYSIAANLTSVTIINEINNSSK